MSKNKFLLDIQSKMKLELFEDAQKICIDWIYSEPEDTQAKIIYARVLLRLNLDNDALTILTALKAIDSTNTTILQLIVLTLCKLTRYKEAADICLQWIPLSPDALLPKLMYARTLTRMGSHEQALIEWQQLCIYAPNNPELLQGAVGVLVKLTRYKEAADVCLRWQALLPDAVQPKLMYTRILSAMGLDEQTLDTWSALLEIEPYNLDYIQNKSAILLKNEYFIEAENLIQSGLRLSAKNINLLQLFTKLLITQRRYEEADNIKLVISQLNNPSKCYQFVGLSVDEDLSDKINFQIDLLINNSDDVSGINDLFGLLIKAEVSKCDVIKTIQVIIEKSSNSTSFFNFYCSTILDVFFKVERAVPVSLKNGTDIIVSPPRSSNKIVIIFTGLAGKISSFPISLLDMYFGYKNISTVVVDDSSRNLFLGGIKSLGNGLDDTIDKLKDYSKGKDIYVMSNSAGGMAAIKYGTLLNAKTALCFGGQTNITTSYLHSINDTRGGVVVKRLNNNFSKQLLDSKFALNHSGGALKVMLCYGELHEQDSAHANNLCDTNNVFLKPLKHFDKHYAFLGAIEQGVIEQLFEEFII
jgi:tetratricopeptide (TPR) repeat protein